VVSLPKTTIEALKDSKICKLVIISCFISCLIFISSFSSSNLFAQENSDCMECHADPAEVDSKVRIDHVTGEVEVVTMVVDEEEYHASAHGGEDFYCIDCHADLEDTEGEHYPNLQPVDCVTFCHDDPAATFLEGSHASLMKEQGVQLPTCKYCHTGQKSKMNTPRADNLEHRGDTIEKCGGCHESYYRSYRNNLHGQVTAMGYVGLDIATCVDCHGQHTILNSSNPESTLGPENAKETCGKCHPGAGDSFVKHVAHPGYKDVEYYKSALVALKNIRKDPEEIKSIVKSPQTLLTVLFLAYVGLLVVTFIQFGTHMLFSWLGSILDDRKESGSDHG
jgi:hypothetical protein